MQNSDCKLTISCHGYAILLTTVENIRRHNQIHTVHEKINNSVSFHGELYWKITVHGF